jgi:hypothetical protein
MCVHMFLGVNAHTCSYIYKYLRLYCIFLKKIGRNFVIKFSNLIPLDYISICVCTVFFKKRLVEILSLNFLILFLSIT